MIQERESRRHRGLKVFVLLCAVMTIALPAMAAKGGSGKHGGGTTSGGGGTIAFKMVDPTDTVANAGDDVTFTISTTATQYPYVQLLCYVNGSQVSENWQGYFPTALGNQWFVLGAVDSCTANLEMYVTSGRGSWQKLNSTSFQVSP
jgi:hypothetical protein